MVARHANKWIILRGWNRTAGYWNCSNVGWVRRNLIFAAGCVPFGRDYRASIVILAKLGAEAVEARGKIGPSRVGHGRIGPIWQISRRFAGF